MFPAVKFAVSKIGFTSTKVYKKTAGGGLK